MLEATELGQLVYRYADRMFSLSYEMIDTVRQQQFQDRLFKVGVADALSKRLTSRILLMALSDDNSMRLRCHEAPHDDLVTKLSEHKLDVVLSDSPVDPDRYTGVMSKKIGECGMSFFLNGAKPKRDFPQCLNDHKLLMPSLKSALGRQLMRWFHEHGVTPDIIAEFDDAALMKAFAACSAGVFIAPSIYREELLAPGVVELGSTQDVIGEYYVIFAERMLQHPAVVELCIQDFTELFEQAQTA